MATTTDAQGNTVIDESTVANADYQGSTITVDTSKSTTLGSQQEVLTEEINHAGDAMSNPVRAAQEKVSGVDKNLPHNKRPGEQRVGPKSQQVQKERREYKKSYPREYKKDQKTPPAQ